MDQNNLNGSSIYYRLASCGQDNQICFWDLTEDVLKEKNQSHVRTRLTSINASTAQKQSSDLPQIIIQPSELNASRITSGSSAKETGVKSSLTQKSSHSSLVSTARNLFSLKHSELSKSKSSKSKSGGGDNENEEIAHKSSSSSSFFKKVSSMFNICHLVYARQIRKSIDM